MSGLRELQIGFAEQLKRAGAGAESGTEDPQNNDDFAAAHIVANGIGGARRLQIYRNNSRLGLRGTLQSLYPAIEKMVGEDFFKYCADQYMHEHPSRHGDLRRYGDRFPQFLANFPPCAELEYLPDLAQLEWYCHEVFHAAADDGAKNSLTALQQTMAMVAPDDHPQLKFTLNSASRLLQSRFPLAAIWDMHKQEDPDEVDLDSGPCYLLVIRRSDIEFVHLDAPGFSFLHTLADGGTLGEAANEALAVDNGFDLSHHLITMISDRILTGVNAPT